MVIDNVDDPPVTGIMVEYLHNPRPRIAPLRVLRGGQGISGDVSWGGEDEFESGRRVSRIEALVEPLVDIQVVGDGVIHVHVARGILGAECPVGFEKHTVVLVVGA